MSPPPDSPDAPGSAEAAEPAPAPRRRWRHSLAHRITLLFIGLLVAVQLAGWLALQHGIQRNAQRQLAQELAVGERVLRRLLAQNAQVLGQGARLLAADYGFREAVLSGDVATLRTALDNQGARIGASATAVIGLDHQVRALGEQAAPDLTPALRGALTSLPTEGSDSPGQHLALVGGRAYQFVSVPLRAPLPVGWVVMGFALERPLLDDLHATTGLQAALLEQAPGGPWRVATHTLAPTLNPALDSLAAGVQAPGSGMAPGATVASPDGPLALHRVVLLDGPGGRLHALLAHPVAQALAPFVPVQRLLLAITLLGLGVFAAGSVLTARRVTQPVRQLVRAARRLGDGDLSSPVPRSPQADEIGELADSFERMRQRIAERTRQIHRLAYWDALTELPNAAQFNDTLAQHLAQGRPVVLLLLNLDRVERVNQLLGRALGDALLRTAAQRLGRVCQRLQQRGRCPGALAARIAGDEFALLLPEADLPLGLAVVRQIDNEFAAPALLEGHAVDLSAGMGLAASPAHANQAATLLAQALLAMTEAKRRKAGYLVYDPAQDAGSAQTLSLLGELRHALLQGELRLYLQPKLRLADGRLAGAEALVRWLHPRRGLVPPGEFIPFAEETGFIHELSLWVVDEALRVWVAQQAQGLRLRLSVNLSAHDLMKADLLPRIEACLQRHGAPPAALCLEITESAIALDPQRALHTLQALKRRGFKLSIDDFGAGYTSLAQLGSLPVDELKIDMVFVRTLDQDPDKAAMVRSITGLAHDRQLSVVAEGVENAAILARLRQMGVNEAQGWHVGKPMPAAELAGWAQQQGLVAVAGPADDVAEPPSAAPAALNPHQSEFARIDLH